MYKAIERCSKSTWGTVKISEDQFSREGLKMTSDMHETL